MHRITLQATLACLLLFVTIAMMPAARCLGAAAPAAACASPEHHAFDFWIGTWEVTQNGKPAGINRIERLLGGCALLENWRGSGGVRGHSLNFYDAGRGMWQQTWVDSTGGSLNLEGNFTQGRMQLSSLKSGVRAADRITWTPGADGSVRQLWEHTDDGGKSWQTAFDGLYRRKP